MSAERESTSDLCQVSSLSVSREGTHLEVRRGHEVWHIRVPTVSPLVVPEVHRLLRGLSADRRLDELEQVVVDHLAPLPAPELTSRGWILVDDSAASASGDHLVAWGKLLAELTTAPGRSFLIVGGAVVDPSSDYDTLPALGAALVRLRVHLTMGVGLSAKPIATQVGLEGSWDGESVWCASVHDAYDYLQPRLNPGDTIVVTGFRGHDESPAGWLRGGDR